MAVFVAMFGVFWSTAFMPMLGGPLQSYEARAIGVGWQSLRSGEAATLSDAFAIASAGPVEVALPPRRVTYRAPAAPDATVDAIMAQLLGGPEPAAQTTRTPMLHLAAASAATFAPAAPQAVRPCPIPQKQHQCPAVQTAPSIL